MGKGVGGAGGGRVVGYESDVGKNFLNFVSFLCKWIVAIPMGLRMMWLTILIRTTFQNYSTMKHLLGLL